MRVQFFAAARAAAGTSSIESDASSLGELMSECATLSPSLASVLATSTFLVDGISTNDPSTSLQDVREVDVLPKFAGG